jgi:hypothetical protein
VWIDGKRFSFSGPTISAQAAVAAPGEVLVYVGWSLAYDEDFAPGPVSFNITSSIDDL